MVIKRARSPQSLYDAVADYDLVIVPDSPLADAINRRVETPQFGTFATTPRRLATGRRETAEDRLAFLEVVQRTDHSWKAIQYTVGNALQCWEHQGTVDALLDYDAYTDSTTEDVVEILASFQTTSRQLNDFVVDDTSVAVVGYDQLTPLERSILPATWDRIDRFTDDRFDRSTFHVFDSATDIVGTLLDAITVETAGDVGIVLDSGSPYSALLESALEAAEIPFYGGPGFVDHPDHRSFVCLLQAAYRGSNTTVADVRPVCFRLGIDVGIEHDGKRLDSVDVPEIGWLTDFFDACDALTFGNAARAYEYRTGRSLEDFRAELAELGLGDASLTRQRVDALVSYLQRYEVPFDRENEGVLLADAKSSGYVDRPVVFYLGIDDGWTHSAPTRPWVDTDEQFERHRRQFQSLLQSGSERYYLVQDTTGGQPVTPCLYLTELLDEEFDRFSDLDSVHHTRMPRAEAGGFETEPVDGDGSTRRKSADESATIGSPPGGTSTIETISQSSLNRFVNCPREYFFSQVLDGRDRDYFREGNLFHDFAEFYVDHPELVDDAAVDDAVECMIDEVKPFFADTDEPLRRRKYRVGLETIVRFLDENPPSDGAFLTPSAGWGTNVFADHFGESVDSPVTERWFENPALGAKGKIDLVHGPTHLVDYKSGPKKSSYRVVRSAAVDPPNDTPNFQASLYLSHLRTMRPDERLEFTFVHFLETLDDVISGKPVDLDDALTTITYHPESFDECIGSREAYEMLLDGYNDCVETFEDLGFESYTTIVDDLSFPETAAVDEIRDSAFATAFVDAVGDATSDEVDPEKGCDQALREFDGWRKRSFFREDLDAFVTFIEECIDDCNRYRSGAERFPVDGYGGEPNYRRVDHRDLLLDGERGAITRPGEHND